ncbi:MAG: MFS transporter [Pseudomonadota bacterium]
MVNVTAQRDIISGIPKAAPEGLVAAILLSFLATAGLFYVNIMAAIVDGLVDSLGITENQAGNIGSANIYGAAIGALTAVPVIKRLSWGPLAVGSLLMLLALDLGSIALRDPSVLLAARFVHGVVGGFLVGVAFGVIARTAAPDKTFGMMLFVQFGLGGLGVMFIPQLVPTFGTSVLFLSLASFSVVTLMMVPFLGAYPPKDVDGAKSTEGGIDVVPLSLTLVAIFLFQAGNMALLAFIIRLGLDYGLDRAYTSTALGLATWVALLGPLTVIVAGVKFGRTRPLVLGMALTLAGMGLFHLSGEPWAYLFANCTTGITWGLVIAYLLGMTAEFDAAGRMSALGGFISKMGLATGPLVAGRLLGADLGFGFLINGAIVILAISTLFMIVPSIALDRKAKHRSTEEVTE